MTDAGADGAFSMFGAATTAIARRAEAHMVSASAQWDSWHGSSSAAMPREHGNDDNDVASLFGPATEEIASRATAAWQKGIVAMDKAIGAAAAYDPQLTPPWRPNADDGATSMKWTAQAEESAPTRATHVQPPRPPPPPPPPRPTVLRTSDAPPPKVRPVVAPPPTVVAPPRAGPVVVPPPKARPVVAPSQPPCPAMGVQLAWDQVRYIGDNGDWKLDHKTLPCDPPHPSMEFKGYYRTDDNIAHAWFVTRGAKGPGTRRPNRTSGKRSFGQW